MTIYNLKVVDLGKAKNFPKIKFSLYLLYLFKKYIDTFYDEKLRNSSQRVPMFRN